MSGDPWLDEYLEQSGRTPQPVAKAVSTAGGEGYGPGGAEYWSPGDIDEFLGQEIGTTPTTVTKEEAMQYDFIPGVSRLPSAGEIGTGIQVASAGIDAYNKIKSAQTSSTATAGPGGVKAIDSTYTVGRPYRKRRRRRRLLTAQDKADIAFLHGQLGSGQLGRAAISALLSRRVA